MNLLYRQVYTLAYSAYNELRDALTYARRREKDVASIAPSLHEDQGRRKSSGEVIPTPEDADDGETEVAAISARAGSNSEPAVPTTTGTNPPGAGATAARPGFPGAASVLTDAGER